MERIKIIIGSCVLAVFTPTKAFAGDGVGFVLKTDYMGKYIWRGQNISDDIRDTDAYGTDSDFFFAGVSLSKKF